MRLLLITFVALMLSGCASVQYTRLSKEPQPKLDAAGSAYILVPANAMYFTKECIGSGKAVGKSIYSLLSRNLKRVEMAPGGENLNEGLKKAKDAGFTYLVDSKILLWHDHPTEWSKQWDSIDMQMNIYDVRLEALIDSVEFVGHGTYFTYGGYHPQHILKKTMPEYVNSLFQPSLEVKNK